MLSDDEIISIIPKNSFFVIYFIIILFILLFIQISAILLTNTIN